MLPVTKARGDTYRIFYFLLIYFICNDFLWLSMRHNCKWWVEMSDWNEDRICVHCKYSLYTSLTQLEYEFGRTLLIRVNLNCEAFLRKTSLYRRHGQVLLNYRNLYPEASAAFNYQKLPRWSICKAVQINYRIIFVETVEQKLPYNKSWESIYRKQFLLRGKKLKNSVVTGENRNL